MIFVTGDVHGDIARFKQFKKLFPKYKNYLYIYYHKKKYQSIYFLLREPTIISMLWQNFRRKNALAAL